MTVPFWCVAVGCLLPYLWIPLTFWARFKLPEGLDNAQPRGQQTRLTGLAARALAAHQNAFEALPVFASAVVISHLASADAEWMEILALTWVAARVLHGVFYVANIHPLRSVCFGVGYAAAIALFLLPLW